MDKYIQTASGFKSANDTFTLSDGNKIPCLGFGTWATFDEEIHILNAIQAGYRHIDTATVYKSEAAIGRALKQCGIPRDQFFLTTKTPKSDLNAIGARKYLEQSLRNLQTDYVDLLLIHWPRNDKSCNWQKEINETWAEYIKFQQEGKVKSIGVANFMPHHFMALHSDVMPVVNQIEHHIGYMQLPTLLYCKERNILVEAWSPLGRSSLIDDETVKEVASKYNVSTAQLALRFCLQNGTLPIAKTSNIDRMQENKNIFNFIISAENMSYLQSLPQLAWLKLHPDLAMPPN